MPRNNMIIFVLAFFLVIAIIMIIGLQLLVIAEQQPSQEGVSAGEIALRIASTVSSANEAQAAQVGAGDPVSITTVADPLGLSGELSGLEGAARTDQPGARLLAAANLAIVDDPAQLFTVIAQNPYAIGFTSYPAYSGERDELRTVKLQIEDGRIIEPAPDLIMSGGYPLSRTYYLYTTSASLRENTDVASFIGCYLHSINDEIGNLGFFPARQAAFQEAVRTYHAVLGLSSDVSTVLCTINDGVHGSIRVIGDSGIGRMTRHMVGIFENKGFQGNISIEESDMDSAFRQFCTEGTGDVVNASRPIEAGELANCLDLGRAPLAFAIGEDAVSVIISAQNDFAQSLSLNQLHQIFIDAQTWSDVNPNWPAQPIQRVVPDPNSNAFSIFVHHILDKPDKSSALDSVIAQAAPPKYAFQH